MKLKVFRQDESVVQECEKKIVIGEGEYHFFYLITVHLVRVNKPGYKPLHVDLKY